MVPVNDLGEKAPRVPRPLPGPDDRDHILKTFWLGWDIAEFRGRCRPEFVHVRPPPSGKRVDHALPLGDERSAREQEIQLLEELAELGTELELDRQLPGGTEPPCRSRRKLVSLRNHRLLGAYVRDGRRAGS
jgi:hypothetical protein